MALVLLRVELEHDGEVELEHDGEVDFLLHDGEEDCVYGGVEKTVCGEEVKIGRSLHIRAHRGPF